MQQLILHGVEAVASLEGWEVFKFGPNHYDLIHCCCERITTSRRFHNPCCITMYGRLLAFARNIKSAKDTIQSFQLSLTHFL